MKCQVSYLTVVTINSLAGKTSGYMYFTKRDQSPLSYNKIDIHLYNGTYWKVSHIRNVTLISTLSNLNVVVVMVIGIIGNNSIQFNSRTLLKDGDPVSSQLIFPGAIQTCEQYNIFSYIYTKQHTSDKHR